MYTMFRKQESALRYYEAYCTYLLKSCAGRCTNVFHFPVRPAPASGSWGAKMIGRFKLSLFQS